MLATTALLIPLASGLFGLPNDTDVLLGGGGKARAILTLDASCSMGGGTMTQLCPSAFPAQSVVHGFPHGVLPLSRSPGHPGLAARGVLRPNLLEVSPETLRG